MKYLFQIITVAGFIYHEHAYILDHTKKNRPVPFLLYKQEEFVDSLHESPFAPILELQVIVENIDNV